MPQNDCKKYSDMIYEYTADMLSAEKERPDAACQKLFLLPQ